VAFTITQRHVGDSAAENPQAEDKDAAWLKLARDAYTASTDYYTANLQKQVDDAIRAFDSRHASDSKYYSEAYKYRSKTFRTKPRTMVRRHESAVDAALFSGEELLDAKAFDQGDALAALGARVGKALVTYRLKHSIPWYLIAIGAAQDAFKTGVCISYNYWEYAYEDETVEQLVQAQDPDTGETLEVKREETQRRVKQDHFCIELMPVDQVRFSPAAKWYDVIGTSPYVIRIVPMYLCDVEERMDDPPPNAPKWRKYTRQQIIAAGMDNDSATERQARNEKKQDPYTEHTEDENDFTIVFLREYFVKRKGKKMVYWTIGDELMLSDPEPLGDVYLHGEIPITMGVCAIETHRVVPKGLTGMSMPITREANEVANQRLDNVKLVLNKQYLTRAGANIDTSNLRNNIPGATTAVGNVEADVKVLEFTDVTGSSFQEQDRLNAEFDELTGSFSASSINSNRNLNETVGGLQLLNAGASAMTEYTIKTWVQTWVIPTLNQCLLLEKEYETDQEVITAALNAAGLGALMQQQQITLDQLLGTKMYATINVGQAATDPNLRLMRFTTGMNMLTAMTQNPLPGANIQEISTELFSILGYADGRRFFSAQDFQKQVLDNAQQLAQKIVSEAEQNAQTMFKAASDAVEHAMSKRTQAQNEQMQLLREEMALLQRAVAQAIRELAFERDHIGAAPPSLNTTLKSQTDSQHKAHATTAPGAEPRLSELQAAAEELQRKAAALDPLGREADVAAVVQNAQDIASQIDAAMKNLGATTDG